MLSKYSYYSDGDGTRDIFVHCYNNLIKGDFSFENCGSGEIWGLGVRVSARVLVLSIQYWRELLK